MRTAVSNPFTPGSDTVPPIWAGRNEQISDWVNIVRPRRSHGIPERGRTFLGEAGVGKSTLVRRIFDMAASNGDWVTPQIRIPAGADPLKGLAAALLQLAKDAHIAKLQRLKVLCSRVQAISVSGLGVTLRSGGAPEPYSSLSELLIEIGKAAQKENRVVLIHIDEVQNMTNANALSQLLVALGDAITYEWILPSTPGAPRVRSALPIAVYFTGLPEFLNLVGTEHGATFSRRFRTETLETLQYDDLASALRPLVVSGWGVGTNKVYLAEDAAAKIVDLSKGDPFLFQLAGERAWYCGTDSIITVDDVLRGWASATSEAATHINRMITRLPERQRQFVETMAQLPPDDRTGTNIARAMGFEGANSIGSTAQYLDDNRKIIKRGSPYTFRNLAIEAYLSSSWPNLES